MLDLLRSVISHTIDLIYPPRCPYCDSFVGSRGNACAGCEAQLIPLMADANIVLSSRAHLGRVRSCFAFDGPAREIVHAIKYSGRLDVVRYMSRRLACEADRLGDFDAIASVPADRSRLVDRGLDSAALLAEGVARISSMPFERNALMRVRSVPPQVGLPREERERNVRGAFSVGPRMGDRLEGRRVLLVDDVITTGATLCDCARVLIRAGAREVCAVTFARAL